MRFKTLLFFVAIQMLSFMIWKGVGLSQPVLAKAEEQVQVEMAEDTNVPSAELDALHGVAEQQLLAPDISERNIRGTQTVLSGTRKQQIMSTLKNLPVEHANTVKNVILDYDPAVHRGMGGNHLIILRGVNMDTEEFVGVFVHEIAHNVDYAALEPSKTEEESAFVDGSMPVYVTDPSLDFYRISWEDSLTRKKTATNMDFVSGYAMSNPFEDFAETYTYYVLHGNDFRGLTASSSSLYAKYRFMKYRVFNGQEFDTDDGKVRAEYRPWDTTVIAYDLNTFLIN